MMSYAPYYPVFGEEVIKKYKGLISDLYPTYEAYVSYMKTLVNLDSDTFDKQTYLRYSYLWRQCYQRNIFNVLLDVVDKIETRLFCHYFDEFVQTKDIDLLSRIFGEYYFNDSTITDLGDLLKNHKKRQDIDDEEEDFNDLEIDEENIHDLIELFHNSVVNGTNLSFLNIKPVKDVVNNMFGKGIPTRQPGYIYPIKLKEFFLNIFAHQFDGIRRFKYLSFETSGFKDRVSIFDYSLNPKKESTKYAPKFTDLKIDDTHIEFPIRTKEKASKSLTKDNELPAKEVLDYGTYLHRLLELVDYKTKDTSFIKVDKDRAIIDKVLNLKIFDDLSNAEIYQEYGYYDEELSTVGFIDLLIVKNGHYYIIDYKANDISDPEYEKQLHTYQRNIQRIFNVDASNIGLYLISIQRGMIKKVG